MCNTIKAQAMTGFQGQAALRSCGSPALRQESLGLVGVGALKEETGFLCTRGCILSEFPRNLNLPLG